MARPQTSRAGGLRARLVLPLIAVAGGCLALAVSWRVLAPAAVAASDHAEELVARDGTFGLLATLLGVATAIVFRRRPGPVPALRLVLVLALTLVGAVLAAVLGGLAGGPHLTAPGMVLVWPLSTAVTTALATATKLLVPSD